MIDASRLLQSDPFGDDEDIRRLYAALSWEAGGRRTRRGLVGSVIVHSAAFLAILFGGVSVQRPVIAPEEPFLVTRLPFVPNTSPGAAKPAAQALPTLSTAPPVEIGDGGSNLKVELTGIKLEFERDVGNELPKLVKREKGGLVLLTRGDQDIADYLFTAPDWKLVRGPVSIRKDYLLLMDPPEDWTIFRELETRNGIPSGKFQGGAVFDLSYSDCITKAIKTEAISSHKSDGTVVYARLKLTLDDPCGVVGTGVGLAPKSER
jgi:hypothetical protein